MENISFILIIIGVVILVCGLLWTFLKKSRIGRLPGDIVVKKKNFVFYFPLVTSLIISLLVTLLLLVINWFSHRS